MYHVKTALLGLLFIVTLPIWVIPVVIWMAGTTVRELFEEPH